MIFYRFLWIWVESCQKRLNLLLKKGSVIIFYLSMTRRVSYLCLLITLTLIAFSLASSSPGQSFVNSPGSTNMDVNLHQLQSRQLQSEKVEDRDISYDFNNLIRNLNKVRSKLQIPLLSQNTTLSQVIEQWSKTLRGRMDFVAYLQIFGFKDIKVY